LPNLVTTADIMIEATNGVTHQKSRPLRRHETLTAIGHIKRIHEWTGHTEWPDTYDRLRTTTPQHKWERILTTLHSLEMTKQEAGNTEKTEEKRTMVARVINRWTTLPEPTKEDWVSATETDHDFKRITTTLSTGTPLLKASLHEKKYYDEWTKDKLELEDGIVYQYEEPKATKIRQLR
jgi:hypothetical protein